MHIWLVNLLLISTWYGNAQSVNTRLGGRAAAMGYAGFCVADESAIFNNVGALAHIKQSSAFFCYDAAAEIPGANRTGASLSVSTAAGTAAFGFFRFGDMVYNEQMLSVAFGNRIGITSLGVKINYVQYQADGFGSRSTITADLGCITQLTPQFSVGAGIFNITQSKIADDDELPVVLVAAFGFQPDQKFLFATEVEKRPGSPAAIKSGVEYGIYKKLFFRTGINLYPASLFGGIGTKTNRVTMDYAMKFSNVLGFAHQASASYSLKPRKNR